MYWKDRVRRGQGSVRAVNNKDIVVLPQAEELAALDELFLARLAEAAGVACDDEVASAHNGSSQSQFQNRGAVRDEPLLRHRILT